MKKETKNWANPEQYAEAKVILEKQKLDTKNIYLYEKVLKAKGYDTFMGDLKPWIAAQVVEIDLSGIKSEVA